MRTKRKPKLSTAPLEYFFAVRKLGRLQPNDYWEAYQIEMLIVQDNKIVRRWLFDKPDTKQMTMAKMELMINPDQPEIPQPEVPDDAA